jgi:hypothetical protein
MTKPPKRPRDFSQAAKFVVEVTTGEREDREPTPEEQGKDRYWPVSGTGPFPSRLVPFEISGGPF